MKSEVLNRVTKWRSSRKLMAIVSVDLLLILASVLLSIILVTQAMPKFSDGRAIFILLCPVVTYPFLRYFKVYRTVIRFLTAKVAWAILRATSLSFVGWTFSLYVSAMVINVQQSVATAVVAVFVSVSLLVGMRYLVRHLTQITEPYSTTGNRIGIYGTSGSSVSFARSLKRNASFTPVCFFDELNSVQNTEAEGLPILSTDHLEISIEAKDLDGIVIVDDNFTFDDRRKLLERLLELPVSVQILPTLSQSLNEISGQVMLRNVRFEDLMNRKETPATFDLFVSHIEQQTILVTGGAGSIGSALCKEISKLSPKKLIVLDLSESGMVELRREMTTQGLDNLEVEYVLGSIDNRDTMERLLETESIDIVYHAAAYKHVDMLEENVLKAVTNNIIGTALVCELAAKYKVKNFVLISSDKAVNPAGILGATKRWCELLIESQGNNTDCTTRFCAVRFGNVYHSSGSVIPLFQKQIVAGGPVTVTDKNMTRYFMSVREAAELIVQASSFGKGGEILFLDMGEPVNILNLAKTLVKLSGKTIKDQDNLNGQIEIIEIGKRSGEKMREQLHFDDEELIDTEHKNIKICVAKNLELKKFRADFLELESLLESADVDKVREKVLSI